jgi:glutathione S-transferase
MELILHNHPRSLFSEKVRRVLAYKGLAWTDVIIPSIPPKTNFVPLTGGYRRMPVLQIGADIYCDSALILHKLEEIAPFPLNFPIGGRPFTHDLGLGRSSGRHVGNSVRISRHAASRTT